MGRFYRGTGTAENGIIRLDDAEGLPTGRMRVTVVEEAPATVPVRRSSRHPVGRYRAEDWPYAPEADCRTDWDDADE